MTRLEQLHQRKRDNEADGGPFQASQKQIKHPVDCSADACRAQLVKALRRQAPVSPEAPRFRGVLDEDAQRFCRVPSENRRDALEMR
jgi:hypothetical protein